MNSLGVFACLLANENLFNDTSSLADDGFFSCLSKLDRSASLSGKIGLGSYAVNWSTLDNNTLFAKVDALLSWDFDHAPVDAYASLIYSSLTNGKLFFNDRNDSLTSCGRSKRSCSKGCGSAGVTGIVTNLVDLFSAVIAENPFHCRDLLGGGSDRDDGATIVQSVLKMLKVTRRNAKSRELGARIRGLAATYSCDGAGGDASLVKVVQRCLCLIIVMKKADQSGCVGC